MPAGIQVLGSHGFVQIDQKYKNLVFIKKGYFTPGGGGPRVFGGAFAVTGATSPLIAIRSNGNPAWVSATSLSGGTLLVNLFCSAPDLIQWFHFDVPPTPASTSGLQIFTDAGELAFDSNLKYMKVVGFIDDAGLSAFAAGQEGEIESQAGMFGDAGYYEMTMEAPYPITGSGPPGSILATVQMVSARIRNSYGSIYVPDRDFAYTIGSACDLYGSWRIEPVYNGHFDSTGGSGNPVYRALLVNVAGL